jgi:hypothetical protein
MCSTDPDDVGVYVEDDPTGMAFRVFLDQMAQAQAAMFYFQRCLFGRASAAFDEQAGAMVERFQKMFLRALCELRKAPPAVFVQNAGQVNVAAQQLNMGNGDGGPRGRGRPRPRPMAPEVAARANGTLRNGHGAAH